MDEMPNLEIKRDELKRNEGSVIASNTSNSQQQPIEDAAPAITKLKSDVLPQ